MLRKGLVSHNNFYFYASAIGVSLVLGDREVSERYAAALDAFTCAEPLPWRDSFTALGRTLAAWYGGVRSTALTADLGRLSAEAQRAGLLTAKVALDQALGRL